MARACAVLTAALGLCFLPAGAQKWFDLPERQDRVGDLSDEHREALKRLDPGVQGSQRAVGSAAVREAALLREHGAERPGTVTIVADPDKAGQLAGVQILNSTPANSFGTSVVRTDHGPLPVPLWTVHSAWKLEDRPRRIALMVMEMQEDYRHYIGFLVDKIAPILKEFRAQSLPVFFTTWVRRPNDGLYGGGDRAAGIQGVRARMNGGYIYAEDGAHPMKELFPTPEELDSGHLIKSIHSNKFADLDVSGRSILSDKFRELGVDTVVLTGGWSDICVLATALAAVDTKNLDVLVVSDAVATTDTSQQAVLTVMNNLATLMNSSSLVDYLRAHRGDASYLLEAKGRPLEVMLKAGAGPQVPAAIAAAPALLAAAGASLLCAALVALAACGLQRLWRSGGGGEPVYTRQPCAGNV